MSNVVQLELPFNEPEKRRIYLAGPMTGYPNLNHDRFNSTAEAFEEGGWEVFNPAVEVDIKIYGSAENAAAAMDSNLQQFLRAALSTDLGWICTEADAIAMLPGWENSKGARAEHATAVALGLEIIYVSDVTED